MKNLAIWAEKFFSLRCTEGDGETSRPGSDVNGWDFLVEFPPKPYKGSPDLAPAIDTAFAQVKSTIGRSASTKVKLSNVMKACRQAQPWFIFLIRSDTKTGEKALYGLHVWKAHMADGLRAIRRASIDGIPLHKRTLSVRFSEADRINGDVIQWMRQAIDQCGAHYVASKKKLADTLGYEDGYGLASLTVEGKEEDIALAFLGLKKKIKTTAFTFTPTRFGISDKVPKVSLTDGEIEITPEPRGEVELRLRGSPHDETFAVAANLFTFGSYGEIDTHARLRLSAPPLELVWSPDKASTKAFLDIDWQGKRPLREWMIYARLAAWQKTGPLKLEVWNGDKFLLGGTIRISADTVIDETQFFLSACEALEGFHHAAPLHDIQFSLADVNASAPTLSWFGPLLSFGSLRVEFPLPDENAKDIRSFIYYQTVSVGDWTVSCIVRRIVREDVEVDGTRRITTGGPIILERFISHISGAPHSERLQQAYRRAVAKYSEVGEALDFEDIIAFGKKVSEINRLETEE